jgi:hypothetical protein
MLLQAGLLTRIMNSLKPKDSGPFVAVAICLSANGVAERYFFYQPDSTSPKYESPMLVTDLCGSFFLCRLHLSGMISVSRTPSTDSGSFSNSITSPLPYPSTPTSPVPQPLVVELNSRNKFAEQIYKDTQDGTVGDEEETHRVAIQ